jgi:hypothetical protein
MRPHATLEALGIAPLSRTEAPEVYAELYRVARRLRESRRGVVGLVPADRDVAIPALGVQLALVLSDACDRPVALVDGNTRLPALAELGRSATPAAEQGFVVVSVAERVDVITPNRPTRGGLDLAAVETVIERQRSRYAHLLVDLTGYEAVGEHWLGYELCDGVVVVARAGRTRERDLVARRRELPADRDLGTLLVG